MPPKKSSRSRVVASTAGAARRVRSTRSQTQATQNAAPAHSGGPTVTFGRLSSEDESVDTADRPDHLGKRRNSSPAASGRQTRRRKTSGYPSTAPAGEVQRANQLTAHATQIHENHTGADLEASDATTPTSSHRRDVRRIRNANPTSEAGGTPLETPNKAPLRDLTAKLNTKDMIDSLPDLWRTSEHLVRTLAPPGSFDAPELIQDLIGRLQDSNSRQSKNTERCKGSFGAVVKNFSLRQDRQIDLLAAHLVLINSFEVPDIDGLDSRYRVDEIFYLANLASLLLSVTFLGSKTEIDDSSLWEFYDFEFPSQYLSGFEGEIGHSVYDDHIISLAISLRIQYFKALLAHHADLPHFDPRHVLQQVFYLEPDGAAQDADTRLTPWGIEHLSSESVAEEMRNRASSVISELKKTLNSLNKFPPHEVIEAINAKYPFHKFRTQLLQWASLRVEELTRMFRLRQPGGVETIQDLLDKVGGINSLVATPAGPEPLAHGEPNKGIQTTPQIQQVGQYSVSKVRDEPQNPPGNVDWGANGGSSRLAQIKQRRKLLTLPSKYPKGQGVNASEIPERNSEAGNSSGIRSDHPIPTKVEDRRSSASRRPVQPSRKSLLDPQANATKVLGFDNDEYSDYTDDELFIPSNGQDTDTNEDQLFVSPHIQDTDEEEAFQTDRRAATGVLKREPKRQTTYRHSDQSHNGRGNSDSSPERMRRQRNDSGLAARNSSSQAQGIQLNAQGPSSSVQRANATVDEQRQDIERQSKVMYVRKEGPRRFWTPQQDQTLLSGMDRFCYAYNMFKLVQDIYGEELDGRDNVALKDRALNLKFHYQSRGLDLPVCLTRCKLRTKDSQRLRDNFGVEEIYKTLNELVEESKQPPA